MRAYQSSLSLLLYLRSQVILQHRQVHLCHLLRFRVLLHHLQFRLFVHGVQVLLVKDVVFEEGGIFFVPEFVEG